MKKTNQAQKPVIKKFIIVLDIEERDGEVKLRRTDDEWLTNLFPAGSIARGYQHRKSLTCHEQDLNMCKTWVQSWLHEAVW